MNAENKFIKFIKKHKYEIGVGGAIVVVAVGSILVSQNLETVKNFWEKVKFQNIQKFNFIDNEIPIPVESNIKIINIPAHLRTLPEGYHASARKLQEATEKGIVLASNQTIVSPYPRTLVA